MGGKSEYKKSRQTVPLRQLFNMQEELKRMEVEHKMECTSRELYRLESQASAREEQLRLEAGGAWGNLSPAQGGGSNASDSCHYNDVSVDDVFLGELSSNSPTPKKVLLVTPLKRGPSASSTPSRGGSIADEMKEVAGTSSMPSPFCEKESLLVRPGLVQEMARWEESVRRAIIEMVEPAASGRLISALNRAMEVTRKDLLANLARKNEDEEDEEEDEKLEGEEMEQLRREVGELRAKIAAEREERSREARRPADVDVVEARLAEMAALLQVIHLPSFFLVPFKACFYLVDHYGVWLLVRFVWS